MNNVGISRLLELAIKQTLKKKQRCGFYFYFKPGTKKNHSNNKSSLTANHTYEKKY
jgi:hypothetical protein